MTGGHTVRPTVAYHHLQPGHLVRRLLLAIGAFEVCVIAVAWLASDSPARPSLLIVLPPLLIILVAVYVLFGSMTVSVDGSGVHLALGVGLIRRSVPLGDIAECRPVRNSWWYGWGIRLTPRGWLWNVSGWDAVELTYRSGGHFRIGTDEPGRLCAAITAAVGGTAP